MVNELKGLFFDLTEPRQKCICGQFCVNHESFKEESLPEYLWLYTSANLALMYLDKLHEKEN